MSCFTQNSCGKGQKYLALSASLDITGILPVQNVNRGEKRALFEKRCGDPGMKLSKVIAAYIRDAVPFPLCMTVQQF